MAKLYSTVKNVTFWPQKTVGPRYNNNNVYILHRDNRIL